MQCLCIVHVFCLEYKGSNNDEGPAELYPRLLHIMCSPTDHANGPGVHSGVQKLHKRLGSKDWLSSDQNMHVATKVLMLANRIGHSTRRKSPER